MISVQRERRYACCFWHVSPSFGKEEVADVSDWSGTWDTKEGKTQVVLALWSPQSREEVDSEQVKEYTHRSMGDRVPQERAGGGLGLAHLV